MEPNVGMYKIFGFTWFMNMGGITVPFLSIVLHHQPVLGMGAMYLESYINKLGESMSTTAKLVFYGRLSGYLWHYCLDFYAVFKLGMCQMLAGMCLVS